MATMSYLSVIERYQEFRTALRALLASILTGLAEPRLLGDSKAQREAMRCVARHYPFVDLLYSLDEAGVQTGENVAATHHHDGAGKGLGRDRSQRPYFLLARDADRVVVTEPYLSNAGGLLCVTAALKLRGEHGRPGGYVVLDIDLARAVAFLMGDARRRRFVPAFKAIYGTIVAGLLGVVALLLYAAFGEIADLYHHGSERELLHLKPFGVIIFLTLALAVFDLGKTILEEEVLMHKDIYRHSSTRRTITRFIAAILIAVSIEALLLMFKSALGAADRLLEGGLMMLTAVGLLVGLGVYVYLGARAEVLLLNARRRVG